MDKLIEMLNIRNNKFRLVNEFYIRCIAHIDNHSLKHCLNVAHKHGGEIRSLMSAMRSSVKRRYLYEITQKKLELTVTLPSLDVATRWPSTFWMVRNAYKESAILHTLTKKVSQIRSFSISNEVWENSSGICSFFIL